MNDLFRFFKALLKFPIWVVEMILGAIYVAMMLFVALVDP